MNNKAELRNIVKGQYIEVNSGYWIVKINNKWEVRNEVTGEIYFIKNTLKDAKKECYNSYLESCW